VSYVGRFAPSPTGPLHLGSLATAVGSFLHAKQAGGRWLLRIEDIDPPREAPGASADILRTLETFDLLWDEEVTYQHERFENYRAEAERLLTTRRAFRCSCSRRDLTEQRAPSELGRRYPGACRNRHITAGPSAVRVYVEPGPIAFVDGLQGRVHAELAELVGDYVILRRDGLPAYHLAVVMDDIEQRVTHVVRGSDLLLATAVQMHLATVVGQRNAIEYSHLPILTDAAGQKLSKQQGATGVDRAQARSIAAQLLGLLGCRVPRELAGTRPAELWDWAAQHWDPAALAGVRRIAVGTAPNRPN
jgi:glutamyl-Q tRNA(Asp) synthetase